MNDCVQIDNGYDVDIIYKKRSTIKKKGWLLGYKMYMLSNVLLWQFICQGLSTMLYISLHADGNNLHSYLVDYMCIYLWAAKGYCLIEFELVYIINYTHCSI